MHAPRAAPWTPKKLLIMLYLLIVSLTWAFSFGLIKDNLAGVDANFVAFVRILLSFILFIPFLRLKNIDRRFAIKLALIGLIQYGVMYIAYIYSFRFLEAHQVAFFTVFTPLYITLLHDSLEKRFHPIFLLSAFLAVLGMGIVVYRNIGPGNLLPGFLLVQASNICFAAGQVFYKREMQERKDIQDKEVFALLYAGALFITALSAGVSGAWKRPVLTAGQWLTLVYLGVIASGVCFFLWNYGAKKTNIGALAVFNNVKVPLAVAVSILFFNERGDIPGLLIGGVLIAIALVANEIILKSRAGLAGKE